jgi:hypothetical protein
MKKSLHLLAATVLLVGIGCGENAPDSDTTETQELALSSDSKGHGKGHGKGRHGKGHHGKWCPDGGGTGGQGTGTECVGDPASGDSDSDGFCNDVDQCPGDDSLMCDSFDCVDDGDCSQNDIPMPSLGRSCRREKYRCGGIGKCTLYGEGACDAGWFAPVCTCAGHSYANPCDAAVNGEDVAYEGECLPPR